MVLALVLVLLGAGWGFSIPMTKIAVSTGFQHFGLIFWQTFIGSVLMAVLCAVLRLPLPFGRPAVLVYIYIAVIGTLVPNSASYQAAAQLPSGVMSLLLSMVPMFAFPIALALRLDQFSPRRFLGLLLGLGGVLMIILPDASLSGNTPVLWVGVALIASFCYGVEGNCVAKWGTAGLGPLQVLYGASLIAALVSLPMALLSDQWISPRALWSVPGAALTVASAIHVLVYAGYVWMVGRAGPVFAVQVSYLVTGFGIFWASLLLSERFAPTLWIAMGLMFAGMYFVQPRARAKLALEGAIGESQA
jgi:drug/metabolite transporter (DMT)-like permease